MGGNEGSWEVGEDYRISWGGKWMKGMCGKRRADKDEGTKERLRGAKKRMI